MEKRVPPDASHRKARLVAGLSNRSGKEDHSMNQVLVKVVLPLAGRITVLILWKRKRHR
ncbi:hypothetical protein SBA6_780018 [Candidatus Sulfopaludibacter sp. SbA6]|nr:hypothetical protein SBA6_780018 [Candidatus Sulfopaludibacter sp. SbA6]